MTLKYLYITIFFSLINLGSSNLHDYHVSESEWHWNYINERWEVSMHLFSDDLEAALRKRYDFELLDVGGPNEHAKLDSLLSVYVQEMVEVEQPDAKGEILYVGHDGDIESTFVYFEVVGTKEGEPMFITNRVLSDLFADQRNVCKVLYKDDQTTFHQYDMEWTSRFDW